MKSNGRIGGVQRLMQIVLAVGGMSAGVVVSLAQPADAMTRTIHPCLLGDEPCMTPAPTPQPR